jgi:O-antigen/teichoic acid export membrane protein
MINFVRTLSTPEQWPAFARGMLAYGSAEAATRLVRLVAILIVARQISPAMLGTAALALSLFELIRVLTNVGIGQRIIVAHDDELESICRAASRLFWIICIGVMLIQWGVSAIAFLAFDLGEAAVMLAVLSLVYPMMPAGLVQIFLAMRVQRMGATARVTAAQNIADSILTIALVIIWPSAWAIVLPKLLTAPVWLVLARRTYSWSPDRAVPRAPTNAFASFGPAILGSAVLDAARLHADKLLVGAFLGTEALGLYYFAFNAGLGITQSLVSACNLVLFPHLAKISGSALEGEFRRAFVGGLAVLAPIVAAQVLLAPFYVPILFGENWVAATPYLVLLACAALPLFAGSMMSARYRALKRPYAETALMAVATAAGLAGLSWGAQFSLQAACIGFSCGLAVILIPSAITQFIAIKPTPQTKLEGELS